MLLGRLLILLLAWAFVAPPLAYAETSYFGDGDKKMPRMTEGSRTKNQKITILSLFGAGLLAGGVATYFALDSQSLSDEISASGSHTGEAWTPAYDDKHSRATSSRTVAQVGFGVAGGLAIAGIVTLLVTTPDEVPVETRRSFVAPQSGGLLVGQAWSF